MTNEQLTEDFQQILGTLDNLDEPASIYQVALRIDWTISHLDPRTVGVDGGEDSRQALAEASLASSHLVELLSTLHTNQ